MIPTVLLLSRDRGKYYLFQRLRLKNGGQKVFDKETSLVYTYVRCLSLFNEERKTDYMEKYMHSAEFGL